MANYKIVIIFLIVILIAALFLYYYVFNIYEVTISVTPGKLFADGESTVRIETVAINAFGWKAPFRKAPAEFSITEGGDLVNILAEQPAKGVLILQAKKQTGTVAVLVKSKFSLLPTRVEINIYSNFADNVNKD